MRFKYQWSDEYSRAYVKITANPALRAAILKVTTEIEQGGSLLVMDRATSRQYKLGYREIMTIEAGDYQSRVTTIDGRIYDVNGRLKSFENLAAVGLQRISRTTILNLRLISSFGTEKYARLVVETCTGQQLLVSRHYAQQIREALVCTKD